MIDSIKCAKKLATWVSNNSVKNQLCRWKIAENTAFFCSAEITILSLFCRSHPFRDAWLTLHWYHWGSSVNHDMVETCYKYGYLWKKAKNVTIGALFFIIGNVNFWSPVCLFFISREHSLVFRINLPKSHVFSIVLIVWNML